MTRAEDNERAEVKKSRKLEKEIERLKLDLSLYTRCYELLDNVVRACETGDTQAIEQTAGAGREFLDVNRP